jgi:2-succinyl-5-enolpyruvyl-6-hydroxy-3-cyclohexene-1-carboxylate synthase
VDVTEALKPDLILRFGQEPVSRALSNYLEHYRDVPQIRFQSGAESGDSLHSATIFVDLAGELDISGLNGTSVDPDWYSAWKKEEDSFRRTLEQILNTEPAFTDGHVIAAVTQHLPTQIPFFCSNSFPIRDLSLFGDREEREVYANRGAAGIDGITSTAMGVIHGSGTTCVLLTGDIAFLHDSNALLRHRDLKQPLVVILFNNGGGTIFRMLPVHDFKDQYLEYFETPQQVDINALCTAHGIPHKTIRTRSELSNALLDLPENGGIHVYECQTDADASMSVRRLLWNN